MNNKLLNEQMQTKEHYTILVVDDQPQNIRLLVASLQEHGYIVRGADSGLMALHFVANEIPDLILLDIRMPGMDGFEVCCKLKAVPRTKQIPIIFLSALTDAVDKVKGLSLGAVDYISKPIDVSELLVRVQNQLAIASLQKALQKSNLLLEKRVADRTAELIIANEGLRKLITENKRAEESLRASEKKLRQLFDTMIDAFVQTDMDGHIVAFNESYRAMLGYSQNELIGCSYKDLTPEKWHDYERSIVESQVLTRGYSKIYTKEYRRKDNTIFPVELSTFLLLDENNKPTGMWAIVRDISERIAFEDSLRKSEQRFRTLAEAAPLALYETDADGNCIFVNNIWCKWSGLTSQEAFGKGWQKAIHPNDRDDIVKLWYEHVYSNEPWQYEYRFVDKVGTVRWVMGSAKALKNDKEVVVGFIGANVDITERKKAEQDLLEQVEQRTLAEKSVKKLNTHLLQAQILANMGSFEYYPQENRIVWSKQMYCIFGVNPELSSLSLEQLLLCVHSEDREQLTAAMEKIILLGSGTFEHRILLPDGTTRWLWGNACVEYDPPGVPTRILGVAQDITERRAIDISLHEALTQKDNLIKELYHRTRNNMQVISAMLSIRASLNSDDTLRNNLYEMNDRIKVMALAHEKLYEHKDLSLVNLHGYLGSVVKLLWKQYPQIHGRIQLELHFEPIIVTIDTAIPCGLIVNELLRNAIIHAFPGERTGKIRICIKRYNDTTMQLDIRDTGIGSADTVHYNELNTFGISLAVLLAQRQLQGKVFLITRNGYHWRFRIQSNIYQERV